MKNFYEYKIFFKPFNAELISGILWTLEITGITEEENHLVVYSEKDLEKNLREVLFGAMKSGVIESYEISGSEFEDKNWNEEWEKKIDVIEATENITIKPTFRKYENLGGKLVIEIDPKMSFGTGEHETTQLMLAMLEKHLHEGDKVLDAGSGTGILAIAAVKLGASRAVAFDVDEWCYVNGKENAELNGVTDKIDFIHGDISQIAESEFDLILANINTHILLEIAESLVGKLKNGGKLILSGLLQTDKEKITEKYETSGVKVLEYYNKKEWTSLVFKK